MNIKYRVILKIGYYETWFDFDSVEQACQFATNALTHMVENEDNKKKAYINIQIVDLNVEGEEDD